MTENKDLLNSNNNEAANNLSDEPGESLEQNIPDAGSIPVDDKAPDNDFSKDECDEEDIDYTENPIFAKLSKLSPKKAKTFQIIYGIVCGVICYTALLLEEFFPRIDQLIKYAIWGILIVILFLSFTMGKKTKWDMIPYRLGLAGGIAAAIIMHIIYMAATGKF